MILEHEQNNAILPPRWTTLRYHPQQYAFRKCNKRFIVVVAGRRSGKSENAKRKLVKRALTFTKNDNGRFFCCAPTYKQAERIYWNDLNLLIPREFQAQQPSKSDLAIYLKNGARISVVGLDKPHRIEGEPIDGVILDEYGKMKHEAWTNSIRPGLSTRGREGWAIFIGSPKGRNHFYQVYKDCFDPLFMNDWAGFTWTSEGILSPAEIEAAKRDLDRLTYEQEYLASFVNFAGRVYYPFVREEHAVEPLKYAPGAPLILALDFNVSPGTASIIQEMRYEGKRHGIDRNITGIINEVFIPRNSNTEIVCNKIIELYGEHKGEVWTYGDFTGGNRGTAKLQGSDWTIVDQILGSKFGRRYYNRVTKNPRERERVNAVNSRLKSFDGTVHMLVDPRCTHTIDDFEGVSVVEGSAGEIEKKAGDPLTHLSDGVGYYVHEEYPIDELKTEIIRQ